MLIESKRNCGNHGQKCINDYCYGGSTLLDYTQLRVFRLKIHTPERKM